MDDDSGTLWIVATPIGSLEDLSPRARKLLAEVELILAEDTRRSRRLLQALGISNSAPLKSLHEHNEAKRLEEVLQHLRKGRSAALVSDAGTPVLSDPGFLLVRAARSEGLPVASLPGPSAFITALAASGLPPLPATLVGFLPPRRGPRRRKLLEYAKLQWTIVFFLSPHRLGAEISDMSEVLGEHRPAALLAELSKRYERIEQGSLEELSRGRETQNPRGEYVLVVGPAEEREHMEAVAPCTIRRAYQEALSSGIERREAQRQLARTYGLSRKAVYFMLIENEEE